MLKSKCCGSVVEMRKSEGKTWYYICTKCNKVCHVVKIKRLQDIPDNYESK